MIDGAYPQIPPFPARAPREPVFVGLLNALALSLPILAIVGWGLVWTGG